MKWLFSYDNICEISTIKVTKAGSIINNLLCLIGVVTSAAWKLFFPNSQLVYVPITSIVLLLMFWIAAAGFGVFGYWKNR